MTLKMMIKTMFVRIQKLLFFLKFNFKKNLTFFLKYGMLLSEIFERLKRLRSPSTFLHKKSSLV